MIRTLLLCALMAFSLPAATALTLGGTALAPGDPALPGGGAAGGTPTLSEVVPGGHRLRVLDGELAAGTHHLLLMVHVGPGRQQRDCRIVVSDATGQPRELARVAVAAGTWQFLRTSITIPAELSLRDLALVGAGPAPMTALAGAIATDTPPEPHHLGLRPDPLLPLNYDGSRGLPQIGRILWAAETRPQAETRILLPGTGGEAERSAAQALVSAIDTGWNTLPPYRDRSHNRVTNDPTDPFSYRPVAAVCTGEQVRFFAGGRALGPVLMAAIADQPQLVVIHLTGERAPELRSDGLAKAVLAAQRAGTVVALVIAERPNDPRIQREWQAWIDQLRNVEGALPILDLAVVSAWRDQPGALPPNPNLLLDDGSDRYAPLSAGFANLRARMEWVRFDARDEVDVTERARPRNRTPGN